VTEAEHAGDDDPSSTTCSTASGRQQIDIDLQKEVIISEFADGAFAELDPFSS
jgi:hypothetical protein